MKPLPAMRIVTATGAQVLGRAPFGAFSSVSTDTRTLEPGALFVALRGPNHDGHAFLSNAERAGALAAIVDVEGAARNASALPIYIVQDTLKALQDLASAYRRQFDIPVIAITGTVGKTTTKEFCAAILERLGCVIATRENDNNEIGVPQTLFRIEDDTVAVVLEMGMRGAGQIAELARIARPTHAILTGAGKTHAEFFPDGAEGVAKAKGELLEEMREGGPVALPFASPWRETVWAARVRGPVLTFGAEAGADVHVERYAAERAGSRFLLVTPAGSQDVRLRIPGRHAAVNAAAACCAAIWTGLPLPEAAEALATVEPPAHRLRTLNAPGGFTVVDDCYNAGPESMRAALDVMRDLPVRRLAILGDMRELGADAEAEHAALGRAAAETLDGLVTVGDLGRIIHDSAVRAGLCAAHAGSPEEAAILIRARVQPGDAVLVKGSRALALEHAVEELMR